MIDLTRITTPFGLLDEETQAALKAHGGPYEIWVGEWQDWSDPEWQGSSYAFRVKPQPPKPREWWIVGGCEAWESEALARHSAPLGAEIIHVREVLK
jgi:hypothetical protein